MEEFNFTVVYKSGKDNTNADALSRIQINSIEVSPVDTDPDSFDALSINIDDSESISTIYSGHENINDGILISDRPLNEFSNQFIIIKNEHKKEIFVKFKILFKQKKKIHYRTQRYVR